jgi:hypothetical protein
MRLTPDSYLGIGTATPSATLPLPVLFGEAAKFNPRTSTPFAQRREIMGSLFAMTAATRISCSATPKINTGPTTASAR